MGSGEKGVGCEEDGEGYRLSEQPDQETRVSVGQEALRSLVALLSSIAGSISIIL